jgi:hypothetical protein
MPTTTAIPSPNEGTASQSLATWQKLVARSY